MSDVDTYPKMMYKGVYNPEVGFGPLTKVIVQGPKEEKAKAEEGFVSGADLEDLMPAELKPKRAKVKKEDDAE